MYCYSDIYFASWKQLFLLSFYTFLLNYIIIVQYLQQIVIKSSKSLFSYNYGLTISSFWYKSQDCVSQYIELYINNYHYFY